MMIMDTLRRFALILCVHLVLWSGNSGNSFLGFDCNPPKISLECRGQQLTTFPSPRCTLGNQTVIHCLILSHNRIRQVTPSMFSRLKHLETLKLDDNGLTSIQPGALDQLTSLRTLVLSKNRITHVAPSMFSRLKSLEKLILNDNAITTIQPGSFDGMDSLTDLNLEKNNIDEVPQCNASSTVTALNLAFNPITSLRIMTMKRYPHLTYLYLKKTKILRLPAMIFSHNTKLRTLNLEYTPLEFIDKEAFDKVELNNLNLEGTNISSLPGKGMTFVYKLNINNVINLWELPFKFFKNLWHAEVEYHFHCCLFKQILDGARDATPSFDNYSVVKTCPTSNPGVTTQPVPTTAQQTTGTERPTDIFDRHKESYDKVDMNYTLTFPPDKCVEVGNEIHTTKEKKRLICWPSPDAFNPCEDLLGTTGLRVCTWIVLVFALMGNGLQLIVLLTSKRNKVMYQVLMCNLSLANLLMGIYLTMLAVTDARSYGEYQNHARAWQYGPGCNIAGFLSILSTELAVYTLTVITIERYFTIVHPLKLHMHLSTKQIIILMSIGWSFALTMAALPVFGVSSYQRVAICLPFDVESTVSKAYVSFLLITNGLAFLAVLFCYARMYCSIGGTSCSSVTRVESRVAKKMALLVLSNFACWFPIALLSFIAIYGSPVIGVPTSKFLLVFIYPINSFTNPYLYALGTKHFQLDFLDLLKNFGACHNGIEKLRNRLLDQLTSLPNTSRAYMGSRSSVTSTYRTPPLLSTDNSHSRASMNASGSSSHSFSLRFLSIPKINLVSHRDKYDSSVERSASCISNDTSSEQFPTSQPLLKVEKNGARNVSNLEACRRLSAREVMIGGKVTNMGMFQSLGNSHSPNLRPHSMLRDGEDIKEYRASENKLPVVMVTSC